VFRFDYVEVISVNWTIGRASNRANDVGVTLAESKEFEVYGKQEFERCNGRAACPSAWVGEE
jgi:hypothetical protein